MWARQANLLDRAYGPGLVINGAMMTVTRVVTTNQPRTSHSGEHGKQIGTTSHAVVVEVKHCKSEFL